MPFKQDPEVEAALAPRMALMATMTPPPVGDVNTRRGFVRALQSTAGNNLPHFPDVSMRELHTKAEDGTDILMHWFQKNDTAPKSSVLYIHGGGFIASDIGLYDPFLARYVSQSSVPFLSVEFRYAPEFPYPTSVQDCYSGLQYLHDHASELGIDASRIAIMGDSGGGGLAAMLAHYAKEKGGPSIAKQILIYPMLDDRNLEPDPHLLPFVTWDYNSNRTGWGAYLGDRLGADDLPPHASPGRMTDASGLPPLYIETGELDIFRDEIVEYAMKHWKAGISTELHVHPGCVHAFEVMAPTAEVTKRSQEDRLRVLVSF